MRPAMRQDVLRQSQLAQRLRVLYRELFDPYRPELHYMCGPGPKWHAKHQSISAAARTQETMLGAPQFEPQGL